MKLKGRSARPERFALPIACAMNSKPNRSPNAAISGTGSNHYILRTIQLIGDWAVAHRYASQISMALFSVAIGSWALRRRILVGK